MSTNSTKRVSFMAKQALLIIGIVLISFVLGGQHSLAAGTGAESQSFFQHYFVYPFSVILKTVAQWFDGNYAFSIILVTILLRLVLMPMMLKQNKQQQIIRKKMSVIQPEMAGIQEKMKKAATQEEKMKLQQDLMAIYQKHNFNPLSSFSGCLPVLIQMPILMGLYYAIRNAPEIAAQPFLWFNLGESDLIMAAAAALVYLLQFKLSVAGMPEEQKKQMAAIGYISPIMMGFVSISAPAVLPLYWVVSGCFMIGQTYLSRKLYGPNNETKVAAS
ncbi:MAG: membrane protein insertase YidC [Bacillus sp. (in: firmicutes)]